jgi:SAM-dependent methyltransferase
MEIVNYPNVDVLAVNQRLPFADSSFDAVFSLDVLEHVSDPFRCAAEICRILKPSGYLYVDVPFLQAEHGYPHHYFNASRMGLQQLFAQLDTVSHHVPLSGHPIFTVHQLLTTYLAGLPPRERAEFSELSVGAIVDKPLLDWLDDVLVARLDPDVRWIIASTTQAVLRKPADADTTPQLQIDAVQLPGFPEYPSDKARSDGHEPARDDPVLSRRSFRSRFWRT